MELTPELATRLIDAVDKISTIAESPRGADMITLMLYGALLVAVLVWIVWGIINWRLKIIDKIEGKLEKMQEMLTAMNSKLWSESSLDAKIDAKVINAIHEHEQTFHSHN